MIGGKSRFSPKVSNKLEVVKEIELGLFKLERVLVSLVEPSPLPVLSFSFCSSSLR
jgi:hypothetical protein